MTPPVQPTFPHLLPLLRFWLGLNVVLLVFTLLSRAFTPGAEPLSPGGVLGCLGMTAVGFALGVTYARYWPLPQGAFQRLIRMALLAIPAVGLALALGLLLRPDISALVLALSAFLGAQWRFGAVRAVAPEPALRPPVSRQAARQSARAKR